MAGKRKKRTQSTGVTLEVPVLDYLRQLADREERDRSYCINRIVREHAARQGTPLPAADAPPQEAGPPTE
jgi:hypothetical protein